jgi:hypothetical protein
MKTQFEIVRQYSIRFFPSQTGYSGSNRNLGSKSFMFFEDVHNQILPYGSRLDSPFKITLDGEDDTKKEVVIRVFSDDKRRPYGGIHEVITQFIRKTSQRLAYWGTTYNEIVIANRIDKIPSEQKEEHPKNHIVEFQFPVFIPGQKLYLGPLLFQIIPQEDREEIGKTFSAIPKKALWILRLPKEIGGYFSHKKWQLVLMRSSELAPSYLNKKTIDAKWLSDPQVDLMSFHHDRDFLLARGSNRWGWPARDTWRDLRLDHFHIYRQLQFSKSLAILRAHILQECNELLDRIGITSKLKITGLLSVHEFDEQIKKFMSGEISYEEILKINRESF